MEKKVHLAFRATAARQEELKVAAARRHTTLQRMIEQGLELLLTKPPRAQTIHKKLTGKPDSSASYSAIETESPEEERSVLMLLAVLRSGSRDAIGAVTSNLRVFYRFIGGDPDAFGQKESSTELGSGVAGVEPSHSGPGSDQGKTSAKGTK